MESKVITLNKDQLNMVIAALHCYHAEMFDEAREWAHFEGNGANPAAVEAREAWKLIENIESQMR